MEMKSLEEKLALQPPFMISEDQSKKKKPETDAQRFIFLIQGSYKLEKMNGNNFHNFKLDFYWFQKKHFLFQLDT